MQGKDDQGIAQEGGEDGRPHRGMKALQTKDIAGRGRGVAAGGQSDAAEQVEADPDAPGVVIGKVGDRAEPLGEAQYGDHRTQEQDKAHHEIKRGKISFFSDQSDRWTCYSPSSV